MSRKSLILKGLVVALFVFTPALISKKQELVGLLIYGAPYLVALFLPNRYVNFAAGLCLGAVVVELPFTAIFSFFGGLFPDPKAFLALRILSVLLFSIAVAGLAIYHTAHEREDRTNAVLGGGLSAGYIILATLAGMFATRSSAGIPMHSTEILGQVDKCALEYARHHEGNYPVGLSDLGPNGSGCLDRDFASGRPEGLRVRYYAEQVQNKFGRYHVTLETNSWFNRDEPSFYSDESGIIYHSFGGHIASPRDNVAPNPSGILVAISSCLIQNKKNPGRAYPGSITEFPKDPPSVCSPEFMMSAGLKYSAYGAKITYIPKIIGGQISGFSLQAQPQEYGKDGVRSYVADETGIIRATTEDRAAVLTDPPIALCEQIFMPCTKH